jgi:hypothetical protein
MDLVDLLDGIEVVHARIDADFVQHSDSSILSILVTLANGIRNIASRHHIGATLDSTLDDCSVVNVRIREITTSLAAVCSPRSASEVASRAMASVRGKPAASFWAVCKVLQAAAGQLVSPTDNMSHSPTVMMFLGLRVRYTMHGGATMPLPSTRIRYIVRIAMVLGQRFVDRY